MAGKESWEMCYYGFPSGKGGQIGKTLFKLELEEIYCCYASAVVKSGKYPIFQSRVPDGAIRDIAKLHEITIQDQMEKSVEMLKEEVEKSLPCKTCQSYRIKLGE